MSGQPLIPLLVVYVAAVAAALTLWFRVVRARWGLAVRADG
jgi:branched-subunit amino acid ABC-type transport system permease component